jgi:hypothetical protein
LLFIGIAGAVFTLWSSHSELAVTRGGNPYIGSTGSPKAHVLCTSFLLPGFEIANAGGMLAGRGEEPEILYDRTVRNCLWRARARTGVGEAIVVGALITGHVVSRRRQSARTAPGLRQDGPASQLSP